MNTTAFAESRKILEAALDAPNGVEIRFDSHSDRLAARQRINNFRKADRKESQRIYDATDPSYNTSPYDCLSTRFYERETEEGTQFCLLVYNIKKVTVELHDPKTGELIDVSKY